MSLIRRPLTLAATAFCAVTLAFACAAPVSTLSLSDHDQTETKPRSGDGGTGAGGVETTTGLPCAVSETLSKSCQTCHGATPTSGASAPLVTWSDLQKDVKGKKVFELVKDRIHAKAAQMPPAGPLPDAQIKAIDDWVAGGAKQAAGACNVGDGPPPVTHPFVCDAPANTTVLKSPTPFKWTDASKTDQYMCFGIDEEVSSKRHVIAIGPNLDNLNMVHHMLLFQAKESFSAEPQPCSSTMSGQWKMITGWAPGGTNIELPREAGYPEEGTTHWVIQVHYNNASGKNMGAQDNSGYQLCSTDQLRPNDAGTLAFGSRGFTIPPRTSAYTVSCDYKLTDDYAGVKFFSGRPHMHKLGTAISYERIPGGSGSPKMLVDQKTFSFENQTPFKLDENVAPGDVMRTRCTWANTGDTAVSWGEDTTDEMCFTFITYYPAIPDRTIGPIPIQTWITPALEMPFIGPKCTDQ